MLQNKRKTIGVFAEKVKEEFQMRLCQGIIEEAELQGYNVAIFTNYGKYGQNNQHFIGDQMIWALPCYEEFAGLILALDTMSEKSSRQKILDNVKKYCHCPVVSIREKVEGAVNFLVENTTGMAGLIRHFIELHEWTENVLGCERADAVLFRYDERIRTSGNRTSDVLRRLLVQYGSSGV